MYVSNRVLLGWWFEILPRYGKYRFTHLIVFLGAELDERRVDFLVDRATHGLSCAGAKKRARSMKAEGAAADEGRVSMTGGPEGGGSRAMGEDEGGQRGRGGEGRGNGRDETRRGQDGWRGRVTYASRQKRDAASA